MAPTQKQSPISPPRRAAFFFSPDGKKLVLHQRVYPDCPDDKCNKSRLDDEKNNKVKARSYTTLLFRHWTQWQSKRHSHLMVVGVNGGPVKDLTPGDARCSSVFSGRSDDYAISPDSNEVCYTMNADPVPATQHQHRPLRRSIEGGDAKKITLNQGADASPRILPTESRSPIAASSATVMRVIAGKLVVLDRTQRRPECRDRGAGSFGAEFRVSHDSKVLFFTVVDRGRQSIQMIPAGGRRKPRYRERTHHAGRHATNRRRKTMIYSGQSGSAPNELFGQLRRRNGIGPHAPQRRITFSYALTPLEEFWVKARSRLACKVSS